LPVKIFVKNSTTKPGGGGECKETHSYLCNSITVTYTDFSSPELLHSVDLWLLTDVLVQPIGPVIKGQVVQEEYWEQRGAMFLDCWTLEDPLGEPGRTPLYVGLPSAWGFVDGDLMFVPKFRRASFWGLQQTYTNK
jgi:hypothetical protein